MNLVDLVNRKRAPIEKYFNQHVLIYSRYVLRVYLGHTVCNGFDTSATYRLFEPAACLCGQ